ncbi:M4 family metallopeptidase [Myxococcus sp. K38C18041901]|uniref:M4 family metallopeptidase n=1 Tax=Myxococcus guangdongensis TaxID=2906760 RepID=UPI0020A82D61|nr:M4 family metallopeptidase [Myxococcus guangdongensis]MCP3060440.1 M4 family metallopeptidase [Myxococcus guangdongensis]
MLCLTLSACTEADTPKDRHDTATTQGTATLAGGQEILAADQDQVPTFLRGDFGPVPTGKAALHGLQENSLAPVLARVAPHFKLESGQLFLKKAYVGFDGDTHYRFGVRYHGVEVLGAELRLHARDGRIFAINGDARGGLVTPKGSAIGVALAKTHALGDKATPPGATVGGEPSLVYWRDQDQLILAWRVLVTGEKKDGTRVKDSVLVNALSGDVFERFSHIHSALNRRVHDGQNTNTLPGVLARSETDPQPHADAVVNAAFDNTGAVWRCYSELFERDSYDTLGATLLSTVHHRVNYVNAYWDGEQMVFGDGDGTTAINLAYGLDVIAHELTHAVTEHDSDLIYSGESGGLNESISDIFGAVCEWHSEGKVINSGTFLVGEDIWTPGTEGDALRYMNNPTQDGDSLDDYNDYSNGVDVHYSSGISNLAFYLLSQGGTHPRFPTRPAVTGIGIEMAGRIFYKANRDLLTPNSNFDAAKVATEQAAVQLGYDASVVAAVTAAWKAVNVGVVFEPPNPIQLERNVPLPLSGARGAKVYAWGEVPEGATNLRFTMSGGTGDADLHIRYGNYPTTGLYDCRPYRSGNNEECVIPNPAAGKWYAMVNAYTDYANASLVMKFDGGFFSLAPNVVVNGLSSPTNGGNGFVTQIPPRADGKPRTITVQLLGGTGNADLYVRMGGIPTHSEYDCRGVKETNDEKCTLRQVGPGKLYVWVFGAKGGYQNTAVLVSYPP